MCITFVALYTTSFTWIKTTRQSPQLHKWNKTTQLYTTNGCSNYDRASHLHTLKVTGEVSTDGTVQIREVWL